MLRWILFIAVVLMVFQSAMPWLSKLGVGRMPLDWRFRLFGRQWSLPLGSTILLTALFLVAERVFWHFA
jgi:hypothetical protein